MSIIWALTDNRAGNNRQTEGLAAALAACRQARGMVSTWQPIPLTYKPSIAIPSLLWPAQYPAYSTPTMADLSAMQAPAILIAAGRRTGLAAWQMKRQLFPHSRWVQIMHPTAHLRDCDALILPQHDNTPSTRLPCPHLYITGALHPLTQASIAQAAEHASSLPPAPYIAMMIGGDTRFGKIDETLARQWGNAASRLAKSLGQPLFLTTSRRTNPEWLKPLLQSITVDYSIWHWQNATHSPNPYPAMLHHASHVIVTSDSISMLSEACASGKPVIIADAGNAASPKHHKFTATLIENNHAYALNNWLDKTYQLPAQSAKILLETPNTALWLDKLLDRP